MQQPNSDWFPRIHVQETISITLRWNSKRSEDISSQQTTEQHMVPSFVTGTIIGTYHFVSQI